MEFNEIKKWLRYFYDKYCYKGRCVYSFWINRYFLFRRKWHEMDRLIFYYIYLTKEKVEKRLKVKINFYVFLTFFLIFVFLLFSFLSSILHFFNDIYENLPLFYNIFLQVSTDYYYHLKIIFNQWRIDVLREYSYHLFSFKNVRYRIIKEYIEDLPHEVFGPFLKKWYHDPIVKVFSYFKRIFLSFYHSEEIRIIRRNILLYFREIEMNKARAKRDYEKRENERKYQEWCKQNEKK